MIVRFQLLERDPHRMPLEYLAETEIFDSNAVKWRYAYKYNFPNGYGASVVQSQFEDFELAVTREGQIDYSTTITSDLVRGDLATMKRTLKQVAELPDQRYRRDFGHPHGYFR